MNQGQRDVLMNREISRFLRESNSFVEFAEKMVRGFNRDFFDSMMSHFIQTNQMALSTNHLVVHSYELGIERTIPFVLNGHHLNPVPVAHFSDWLDDVEVVYITREEMDRTCPINLIAPCMVVDRYLETDDEDITMDYTVKDVEIIITIDNRDPANPRIYQRGGTTGQQIVNGYLDRLHGRRWTLAQNMGLTPSPVSVVRRWEPPEDDLYWNPPEDNPQPDENTGVNSEAEKGVDVNEIETTGKQVSADDLDELFAEIDELTKEEKE